MNLLGIGPLELLLIFLLVIIIFGPKDLQKTGKAIGRGLNKLIRSAEWQALKQTSKEIQNLPTRLMKEANLEEIRNEIGQQPSAAKPVETPPAPEPPVLPSPEMPASPSAPSEAKEAPAAEEDNA